VFAAALAVQDHGQRLTRTTGPLNLSLGLRHSPARRVGGRTGAPAPYQRHGLAAKGFVSLLGHETHSL